MTTVKMAVVRHFRFYEFKILSADRAYKTGSVCTIMPNFMAISQFTAQLWQFFTFKIATMCHLGLLKIQNFNRQ